MESEEIAMSLQVIEGTWEEIERRKAEMIGHHLRVTITPDRPTTRTASVPDKAPAQPRVLRARGAFKGMTGGTEALIAEKQAEIELEERNW
jgi:hypothetical protein